MVAVQLIHTVCKMTNCHLGEVFQMYLDVVLLPLHCVLGEDSQQMELDTVFKRLNRFLLGCVMGIAIKIGPRGCPNSIGNNLVPLE